MEMQGRIFTKELQKFVVEIVSDVRMGARLTFDEVASLVGVDTQLLSLRLEMGYLNTRELGHYLRHIDQKEAQKIIASLSESPKPTCVHGKVANCPVRSLRQHQSNTYCPERLSGLLNRALERPGLYPMPKCNTDDF